MKFIVCLSVFCFSYVCFGQKLNNYNFDKTNLKIVLKKIENDFNVGFSFASEIIEEKKITLIDEKPNLENLLSILESQTNLSFEQISKNQIIISSKQWKEKYCGYIYFSETNEPISNTTIIISSGDQISTDNNGYFSLITSEKKNITISLNGYNPKKIFNSENCPKIYFTQSDQVLDEVIISGYITSGIDRKKDGSIDVNTSSLGILPGLVSPDILQSIQLIPGINSLDESASGIQIRGGTPDQNLILFNDIKLFNTGHFYGMFSTLNPYATKSAKIFKSGTSASYGDRVSGIIDITSGENIPNESNYGLGIDGLTIDGYVKTPITKKLAVFAFARRTYSDIYETETLNNYEDKIFRNFGEVKDINGNILNIENDEQFTPQTSKSSFGFHDITTKVIFEANSKNKIIASTLTTRNELDFSFIDDGEFKVDDLRTINNGASLKWHHEDENLNLRDIVFYYSYYESDYRTKEFISNNLDETNIRNNYIQDYGLNIKFAKNLSKNHYIAYGYQISNSAVEVKIVKDELDEPEDNIFEFSKEKNLKNAFFTEYNYKTSNSSLIGFGLRAVHYSNLQNIYLEPRFNLDYKLNNSFRLKVGYGKNHQPITQITDLNQAELRIENNTWRLSNKNNNPLLTSDQMSFGILYNNKSLTIDTDIYYKNLTGLTTFTNGFNTPSLALEQGNSIIKGLDVLVKKQIKNYRIWLGYTFNNIKLNFPNVQKGSFSSNNDITHSFKLSNSLDINKFQFSLGWQFRTGEPFTPIKNFNSETALVDFGAVNSSRLKNFHRLDASAIYNFKLHKFKDKKGQLGLSFLNIYDRKIPLSYSYRSEDEGAGLELKQVVQRFSLGFTTNLSFRLFL